MCRQIEAMQVYNGNQVTLCYDTVSIQLCKETLHHCEGMRLAVFTVEFCLTLLHHLLCILRSSKLLVHVVTQRHSKLILGTHRGPSVCLATCTHAKMYSRASSGSPITSHHCPIGSQRNYTSCLLYLNGFARTTQ